MSCGEICAVSFINFTRSTRDDLLLTLHSNKDAVPNTFGVLVFSTHLTSMALSNGKFLVIWTVLVTSARERIVMSQTGEKSGTGLKKLTRTISSVFLFSWKKWHENPFGALIYLILVCFSHVLVFCLKPQIIFSPKNAGCRFQR